METALLIFLTLIFFSIVIVVATIFTAVIGRMAGEEQDKIMKDYEEEND